MSEEANTESKTGVFAVTSAEEGSVILRDVDSGQVHTLSSNPGVERGEIVHGTVAPDPPMDVTWQLIEIDDRHSPSIVESDEEPTARTLELAERQAVGELTRQERAGEGELHVLTVPAGKTEAAVADILEDEESLLERAGRLGVARIEVRSAPGVVCVRYLP